MAPIELSYRDINFDTRNDCELLANWYNDQTIRHLFIRFVNAEGHASVIPTEHLQRVGKNKSSNHYHRHLLVLADNIPAGEATLEMNPPKLLTKTPKTAWISLMLGDERLRGCGLGTRIIAHLETMAAKEGAERIEVGIFEYNEPSLKCFKKLGYSEFARQPDHVWWNDKLWADIRLIKTLPLDT